MGEGVCVGASMWEREYVGEGVCWYWSGSMWSGSMREWEYVGVFVCGGWRMCTPTYPNTHIL